LKIQPKTKSKINSKAQIETMGLLVIVILISLILFFVLTFTLNNSKNKVDDKSTFVKKQAVSNLGTTLLETPNLDCKKTVRELLDDCGFAHEIMCGTEDSCDAAKTMIKGILGLTLDKWGYEYNLTVETSNSIVLSVPSQTGCGASKSSSKEITPFATAHGQMSMVIKTC
jgi:hypothetical protein